MRYALLGPLEVNSGGERIALGGPKQRLVLAHLLIRANELVSADLLIDEIWGDEPPDAARASLHSYISHLKKALGAERLVSRPPGYVLRVAPDELDAARFESLAEQARRRLGADPAGADRTFREALSLWRGEPFADLAHELSLAPEIERLTALRLGALEDRIEAELALGRHAELATELERLSARHPLRERLAGQLMLALYRSGRQADALAAYHRLRVTLDEQLGLEPAPAVEDLQRRILNHDPTLELAGAPLRGYRLIEQIGAGPLGVVHRAFEPHTEREVAVKVLSAAVANDPDFVRRFEADARRIARLEHPHIVPLLDWWREPDAAYLVMPLLRGGTLTERMAGRQLGSQQALRWVEQLAGALGAAHRQGVVHGDLRPGNVLMDVEGNAYLADFLPGIDPATNGHQRSEAEQRYLAPERKQAEPPSAAADIFAMGIILGELFTPASDGDDGASLRAAIGRATSATPGERYPTATDLAGAVRRALLSAAPGEGPTEDRPLPTRNPYKGLRSFEEADAADFFGREHLVQQLLDRLAGGDSPVNRLLAIVGPSGSGKSSVVLAGLLPALRAGALPGSEGWFVAVTNPGERPFDKLGQALVSVARDTLPADGLLQTRSGLGPLVERIVPVGAQMVLIIDQFEELFSLADDDEQSRFLQVLAATIDDAAAPVRVVITMRADFYDRPLRHEQFGRLLAASTVAVPPLTAEELEQVVARPAAQAGLELEPGLLTRIVAEMSEQPGALPLLQYSLSELWERRDGRSLSLRAYDASGGIIGAVGRRAEQIVRSLDAEGREVARQLFLRLVEPGEGTADTARRVPLADLRALDTDRDRLDSVIDGFARYRLLLFDRDPDSRQPTIELAHEALLRAWPRLQQWVDDARDDLRQQRRLAQAAGQWLEAGRDPSFLLTGSRLAQSAQWSGGTRVLLAPAEREYLAASLAERQRLEAAEEQRQAHETELEQRAVGRLRALVVTFALGALIAGVLSIFAFSESQRAERTAREATARELAAAAVANLDIDIERSILLALEAVDTTRTFDGAVLPEAEEALRRAVRTSRLVHTFPHGGFGLAVTSDGSRFATGGSDPTDNSVTIWDTNTGAQLDVIPDQGPGRAILAFSPDGSILATAPNDGTVRLWDIDSSAEPRVLWRNDASPVQMRPAFSPDGSWVAAPGYQDPTVIIWDVATGAEVLRLRADAEGFAVIAFSPDGSWLASGHDDGSVWIWSLETGEPSRVLTGHELEVNQIDFSPDGRHVASVSSDGALRIWDTTDWEHRTFFAEAGIGAVAFSPDGTRLATGGSDGRAAVWDARTGRRQLTLGGHEGGVPAVAFVPETDLLLTGGLDNTTRLWDLGVAGARDWLTVEGPVWHTVAFSADSARFAVPSDDGGVAIHDSSTGEILANLPGHAHGIVKLAFSPSGHTLAGAGWTEAGAALFLWDIGAASAPHSLEGHSGGGVSDVTYSPDGNRLVSAGWNDGTVRLWDVASGRLLHTVATGSDVAESVAISPDGRLIAAAGRTEADEFIYELHVFDAQTGDRVDTLRAHDNETYGLAFAPDGSLISASVDFTAKGWDLDTGEELWTVHHDAGVNGVAVSLDGTWIATALEDGTTRMWDLATRRQLLTLYGHDRPVRGVVFSPDGRLLATASYDGTVALHLLPLDEFIELGRTRVTRSLTDDECRQYLHLEHCPADR